MSDVLRVHVWSDIACPWSTIGRVRFDHGTRLYHEAGGTLAVELEYHSFELAPDTPVDFDGSELDFLVGVRDVPADEAQSMLDRLADIAADDGLRFDFARVRHANSRKAHELLHAAKARGRQGAMYERLQTAYFTEGRHVGHLDELADLARDVGLSSADVLSELRNGTHAEAVDADLAQGRKYGVRALPFYLVGDRYGVSGAYPAEFYAETITKVAATKA